MTVSVATSQSALLKSGLDWLNQKDYAKAISALQKFCQQCSDSQSKAYLQAQMGLVRAYSRCGQWQEAIALCQPLTAHPNPQIQMWATRSLDSMHKAMETRMAAPSEQTTETSAVSEPSLPSSEQPASSADSPERLSVDSTTNAANSKNSDQVPLDAESATKLYRTASSAMRQGRYAEAIAALEPYCRYAQPGSREAVQAHMWLAKAYQNSGQLEEAVALGRALSTINVPALQIWANQFLGAIGPAAHPNQAGDADVVDETAFSMPSLEEFKRFCQQEMADDLRQIEKTRKQVLRQITIVGIILGVILAFLLTVLPGLLVASLSDPTKFSQRFFFRIVALLLLGIIACLWGWVAFYSSSTETYARGFSETIIQKIIAFIDPNRQLIYSKYGDNAVILSSLNHSQLFPELAKQSHLNQDDCVSGTMGKTTLYFSEIVAETEFDRGILKYIDITRYLRFERPNALTIWPILLSAMIRVLKGGPYVVRRMLKGQRINYQHFKDEVIDNRYSRRLVFKGLFFIADFNKHFQGRTTVLPDSIGSKVEVLNRGRGQAVKLEDPQFKKLFSVYGTDQVEARYILSTSLMERLITFRGKANRKVYVSFVDSLIYLAVSYQEDLFEPRLFKTMLDFQPLKDYYETLQLMLGIVEDLNLNQRIWTKQ